MLQSLLSKVLVREMSILLRMHLQTHTIDARIHSSSDQSETNAFSSEIGSSNVEYFSLQGDTVH